MPVFQDFVRDLGLALKALRRSPGFGAVAIITLALGIGANSAIFTLLNAVMLRTLPVQKPEQLVLFSDDPSSGMMTGDPPGYWWEFSYPCYLYLREHNQSFDGLSAFQFGGFRIAAETKSSEPADGFAGGSVEVVRGQVVSGNYFSLLGVGAAGGRTLVPEDDRPGAAPVGVISYAYWERKFGRDPAIVGRTVVLNGTQVTIAGVAAREFFGERVSSSLADYWLPISLQPQVSGFGKSYIDTQDTFWLNLMGRLKPGVTIQQADAELNNELRDFARAQFAPKFSGEHAADVEKQHLKLVPGGRGISLLRATHSTPLRVLVALVGLVLLVACVNVANLMLSRAAGREKEISLRLALGAGRNRIMRQMLTESLVIAGLGGALGLLLSGWGVRLLASLVASSNTPLNFNPDARVLLVTFATCLLTALLSGLAPALRASRMDLLPAITGASIARRRGRFGLGGVLVAAQLGMSLLLVVSAGLFARSLSNLEKQDIGVNRDNLQLIRFDSRLAGYKPDQLPALYHRILDRLGALPAVRSATMAYFSPLSGSSSVTSVGLPNYTPGPGENMTVCRQHVASRYFETLGMPLIAGRFTVPEDENGPPVAVLNETAAKAFFHGENPVGRKLAYIGSQNDPEVVGVVGDVKFDNLRDAPSKMVFLPFVHNGRPAEYIDEIEARTVGDSKSAAREIRAALAELEPHLPITGASTIDENVHNQTAQMRAIADLSATFGLLALIMASVGIYGVMAHRVTSRTREIGVRMAVGAARRDVFAMILGQTLKVALCGIVMGLVAAAAATRLLSSLLFGLNAADPIVFGGSALILLIVSVAACLLPARWATKVDPVVALKYE